MEFYLEETSYFIWRTSTWFVNHLYLNILMIYMRIHLNHSLLVDCREVCRESTHFGFPVHIYDVNINICHHSYILLNRFFHTSNPFFHLSATLRVDVYKFSVSITLFGPLFPLFNAMPGAGCYVFAAFVENLPSLSLYDWVVFRFTGKSIHFLNWKDHLHQGLLKWFFFIIILELHSSTSPSELMDHLYRSNQCVAVNLFEFGFHAARTWIEEEKTEHIWPSSGNLLLPCITNVEKLLSLELLGISQLIQ